MNWNPPTNTQKVLPLEETATCPYDPSHTFAKHKYVFHLQRCKRGKQIGHLFRVCRFNPMHIIPHAQILSHESQCVDGVKMKAIVREIQVIVNTPRMWIDDERVDCVKSEEEGEDYKVEEKVEEGGREEGNGRMISVYGANPSTIEGWGDQTESLPPQPLTHQEQMKLAYSQSQLDCKILELLFSEETQSEVPDISVLGEMINRYLS